MRVNDRPEISEPPNNRLKMTARLFFAERPQLSRSIMRMLMMGLPQF